MQARVAEKAARLAAVMPQARSLKDAARLAGIPERTARRIRARLQ